MWLWWLLIAAGVVAVIVGLVRAARPRVVGGGTKGASGRGSARQLLDERFARGEIDREEYRARWRELDEH